MELIVNELNIDNNEWYINNILDDNNEWCGYGVVLVKDWCILDLENIKLLNININI